MRVLIVEDNSDIAANISDFLESEGCQVEVALDGVLGLHLAVSQTYDVIVLDLMLPGIDGIHLCRQYRQAGGGLPILMLTARDTLNDKLVGFDAGTDDYLVKPFALEELLVRLRALVARGRLVGSEQLRVGSLCMNLGTRKVSREGVMIEINKIDWELLRHLMEASPNILSRETLIYRLWGDHPPGSDALRTHMYVLRQAVDKPFEKPMLETVRGVGYRLMVPE